MEPPKSKAPYRPSIGINLLPTKAQLKSYRKARKAHSKGNTLEADQILSEGGYGITTSNELFESWGRWNQKKPATERISEKQEAKFEKIKAYQPAMGINYAAAVLTAGLLVAVSSVGYQYIIKPYLSQQVSIQRPAQIAQQKPEAKPAAPKREPDALATPEQQKSTFHGPIVPPATQPGTTEPRVNVQEPTAPTAAPERPPAPAQGATRPAPTQKVFFYRDEYGARRELPVYDSRWTIDKASAGNEGENRARLLLETFYDVNRDGYNDNFEPQLPIELGGYTKQEAEEVKIKFERCKGKKETVYVFLGRNINPQTDKNNNVLRMAVPKGYVEFRSQGCLD